MKAVAVLLFIFGAAAAVPTGSVETGVRSEVESLHVTTSRPEYVSQVTQVAHEIPILTQTVEASKVPSKEVKPAHDYPHYYPFHSFYQYPVHPFEYPAVNPFYPRSYYPYSFYKHFPYLFPEYVHSEYPAYGYPEYQREYPFYKQFEGFYNYPYYQYEAPEAYPYSHYDFPRYTPYHYNEFRTSEY